MTTLCDMHPTLPEQAEQLLYAAYSHFRDEDTEYDYHTVSDIIGASRVCEHMYFQTMTASDLLNAVVKAGELGILEVVETSIGGKSFKFKGDFFAECQAPNLGPRAS